MLETRCAGCGYRGEEICPNCRDLPAGEIAITGSQGLEWAFAVLGAVLLAVCLLLASSYGLFGTSRLISAVATVGLFSLAWGARGLRRPRRIRLVADHLEIVRAFGRDVRVPLTRVRDDLGCVVLDPENVRIRVGEARYPGAADFHRALRVRIALATASGRARTAPQ